MYHFAQILNGSLAGSDDRRKIVFEFQKSAAYQILSQDLRPDRYVVQILEHIVVQSFRDTRPFVPSFLRDAFVDPQEGIRPRCEALFRAIKTKPVQECLGPENNGRKRPNHARQSEGRVRLRDEDPEETKADIGQDERS